MAFTVTTRYRREIHRATAGDIGAATIRAALMSSGFTFNPDAHETWADVSASELSAGNGYTANGQVLANANTTNQQDETNDRSDISWDNVVWNASGGNIGGSPGAIFYIDSHVSDIIIGYESFGQDLTAFDGNPFTLTNPLSRVS